VLLTDMVGLLGLTVAILNVAVQSVAVGLLNIAELINRRYEVSRY